VERIDVEQGSTEWLQARCGLVTASAFSRFITPARAGLSKQSVGYIADLIVESVEGPAEHYSNYYMDRGLLLEDEAAAWYEFKYDCETEKAGLILGHGAGWSPDRLVGTKGALEIKSPKSSTHVKWLLAGGIPDEHKPQCHAALLIGELEWIDFLSYAQGFSPLVVRVVPDDYTAKVEKALATFLEQYAEAKRKVLND